MLIKFLGAGDAFGSGGRLQPCILGKTEKTSFILDCGATCLISMRRYNIDPNEIDVIFLSHLHGDHFSGIPFFILDAQMISKRKNPLLIAGPKGSKERIEAAMEVLFPGSSKVTQKFAIEYREMEPDKYFYVNDFKVLAGLGIHPSGAPSLLLRLEIMDKIIAYTGDTEWTDQIINIAENSDVLISEIYFHNKKIKNHLDYQTLFQNQDRLNTKRIIATHMSPDMLKMVEQLDCEYSDDGKEFII
ncbi:MAG: MBL fold metallo-hydrolase [Dehalobacterium sp.]